MVSWIIDGLDEYIRQLTELEHDVNSIEKKAIHKGAGILADEVRKEIKDIPKHKKGEPGGILEYEREIMLDGLGITRATFGKYNSRTQTFTDDNYLNVKIGFDPKCWRYANSAPASLWSEDEEDEDECKRVITSAMIATAVIRGTSWAKPIPFIRKAVGGKRKSVEEAMQKVFDEEVKKTMNKK